jgi:carboxymethylenebutenolidase
MADYIIDPTTATSPAFNRRVFVGLSAGAATMTGTVNVASAQATFGKPHPPTVAEDDPEIKAQWLKLHPADGPIDAYAAWPANATKLTPGLVVVQHIWGVDTSMRDVVRRYAKQGYVAICPALYSRWSPPSGDGTSNIDLFRPFANRMTDAQSDGDLTAGAAWIRQRAGFGMNDHALKVGVTGFCAGAGIALRQVIDTPWYDALGMFYGNVLQRSDPTKGMTPASWDYITAVRVPVVGSFGGRDQSPGILPAEIVAFKAALTDEAHVPNDIKVYPEAGHAFFDDQRASYVPTAANDAWPRVLGWWKKYLQQS